MLKKIAFELLYCKVPQSIGPTYLTCRITEKCKDCQFHSISSDNGLELVSFTFHCPYLVSGLWTEYWLVCGFLETGSEGGTCLFITMAMTSSNWQTSVLMIVLLLNNSIVDASQQLDITLSLSSKAALPDSLPGVCFCLYCCYCSQLLFFNITSY